VVPLAASSAMPAAPPVGLRLLDLKVVRAGGTPIAFPDVCLPVGGQAVVCGPSGSGKTSLLAAISGLLPFEATEARVGDHDLLALARAGHHQIDRFRARHVGLVPQEPLLVEALDLVHNLMLAQRLAGHRPDATRVRQGLADLGLADVALRRPGALSRGQQQRVALARALINRPQILLADEPTANLDDALAEQAIGLLREQADRHQAVLLIATHDARVLRQFDTRVLLAPIGTPSPSAPGSFGPSASGAIGSAPSAGGVG
jgi:putative ABC transport system ATP-binding protein